MSRDQNLELDVRSTSSHFFRLMAVISWTIVFLVGLEVSLEYRAAKRGFKTLMFSKRSHLVTQSDGNSVYGPTEDFPFRSEIVDVKMAHERLCVWIASASHAEDLYYPPELLFPVVLTKLTWPDGKIPVVLNGSRAGTTTAGNLTLLEEYGPIYRPNIVVLYQMSTDLTNYSHDFAGDRPSQDVVEGSNGGNPLNRWLLEKSEQTTIYELLKTNVSNRISRQKKLLEVLPDESIEIFMADVDRFVKTTQAMNATPILCTFALSQDRQGEIPENHFLGMLRFNPVLSKAGWASATSKLNDRIRRYGSDHDVGVCDLDRLLDRNASYLRDMVHFTPAGHQKVAEILASEIGYQLELQEATASE